MKINRQIFFEVVLLIAASFLLGTAYTYVTKQGFFMQAKPASNLEMISIDKAKDLLASKEALFIDSRHGFEYAEGHIPSAINIPLKEFNTKRDILSGILKNKLIVVYCDGAECNSSIEMAIKLIDSGFTNVKIFFGGWQEWKNNNLPVEK